MVIAEVQPLLAFQPSALKCARCGGADIHIVLNSSGTTIIVSCTSCDNRTMDQVLKKAAG